MSRELANHRKQCKTGAVASMIKLARLPILRALMFKSEISWLYIVSKFLQTKRFPK